MRMAAIDKIMQFSGNFEPAHIATPRQDTNSLLAHSELIKKSQSGVIDLYFLGDSITRRWGTSDSIWSTLFQHWQQTFWGWKAANFGWGGDCTQHILWRIQNGELESVQPKVIVLLAGTNNFGMGHSASEVARGIGAILDVCLQKAPQTVFVLMGIFPRNDQTEYKRTVQDTNQLLEQFHDGERIHYLNINHLLTDEKGDLSELFTLDGLHLTLEGYRVWGSALIPLLSSVLGPKCENDFSPPPTGDPSLRV